MREKGEEHMARLEEVSNNRQFEKPTLRWEDKIKTDIKEIGTTRLICCRQA
jgi:hypothetical protein